MKLNNSIKLSMANFSLFWKILLYKIFAFGISFLFILPIFGSLKTGFAESGFTSVVRAMFSNSTFQSVPNAMNILLSLFQTFFGGIAIIAKTNVIMLIYLAIILLIVVPFLLKLSDVPASEVVYSYMSSLTKNSFILSFINMFGVTMSYSILRTLVETLFLLCFGGGFYGILLLGNTSEVWAIIAPLMLFIYIVLMIALNSSIHNGWASSVVVFNCGACKGFKKGINAVKRNFLSTLSSFSVVMIVFVGLTYIFGIYALFLIIPLSALILCVFGQVLFFESQGMNYYLSPDKIIKPKKLESTDKICKVRYII